MPAPNYFARHEQASAIVTEVQDNGNAAPPNQPYYNPRLDPKNFLEGPLSDNPATRLRQMLARPGIVVSRDTFLDEHTLMMEYHQGRSRYL